MQSGESHSAAPSRRFLLALAGALPVAALPAVAAAEPGGDDAELIAACDRFVACQAELEAILDADEWAPDDGPLHDRYEAVHKGDMAFLAFLRDAAKPPVSPEGRVAIAKAALASVGRTNAGRLPSESTFDWLRKTATVWCAGGAETVLLPDYWPLQDNESDDDGCEAAEDLEPAEATEPLDGRIRETGARPVDPERFVELIREQQRLAQQAGGPFTYDHAVRAIAAMTREAVA